MRRFLKRKNSLIFLWKAQKVSDFDKKIYQKYFAGLRIITIFVVSYPKRKWSYLQNLNFKKGNNTR